MDGIDWGASAMRAAQRRLEIAAGNLANVSTSGFSRIVAHGVLTPRGVHIERRAARGHGPLRRTGRPFDLAIAGTGVFRVRDAHGHVSTTRNGAFVRERDGTLHDDAGNTLLGVRGPLHVPEGATIDSQGRVMAGTRCVDDLRLDAGASVHSGYLEAPNVDAIGEMIDVIGAQRAFESAEKVVAAIDGDRQKASNDVARIK